MGRKALLQYEEIDSYYPFLASVYPEGKREMLIACCSNGSLKFHNPFGKSTLKIEQIVDILLFNSSSLDNLFINACYEKINDIETTPCDEVMSSEEQEILNNDRFEKISIFKAIIEWIKNTDKPCSQEEFFSWIMDRFPKKQPDTMPTKQTKGRKKVLTDMECLKIYRLHFIEGLSIANIAKEFNWKDSSYKDNPPSKNTTESRIKKAIICGRKLTPPKDRPLSDKTGRE